MRKLLIYTILLLLATELLSQNNGETYGFWKFESVDGEAKLRGLYRQKYTSLKDFSEQQESMYYSGGLRLNTRSFIWHPSFLKLEVGGEFFPESNQDEYVVSPDRAEVRTLKGLNLGATLFDKKPLTLSTWANWNESYQNRENLTNIRSRSRRLGSALSFRNHILPLHLRYQDLRWEQLETQTGRMYTTEQGTLEASTQKSFSDRDRNELYYTHNEYLRRDNLYYQLENVNDQVRLRNSLYLDDEKKYMIRSNIHDYRRRGNQSFHIFNLRESTSLKLPAHLTFNGSYTLYNKQEELQKSRKNKLRGSLNHQLFSSLNSGVFYEYAAINHSYYNESRNSGGLDLKYTKKIPTGRLTLSYHYSLLRDDMQAESRDIVIQNEAYVLTDGEIALLLRPYIDVNTVLVKDQSGTIIYQEGFDYLLIEQGEYLEIQRMPGGQIPNGSTVYLDYVARQTGSYRYDAHSNIFSARISLINNRLELYYIANYMDYRNVEKSELLVLNSLEQNTFGAITRLWFLELGAEYEDHQSTITPYQMTRYFLNIQKRFDKLHLSLNGNYRDYLLLDDDITRKYTDISARSSYNFTAKTSLTLLAGYRKQEGTGIDLDLLNAALEFKTRFRKLHLKAGLDLYRRDYLGDDLDYYGAYIQFERKF